MSIPLLLAKRGFHPRQLFAALQGAWLEPTPGYIWQENTGVTPTTAGGQTIGKIADQSGWGNNATQATAANRPTYQLDSNNLPLARFDATDSLSVSLPNLGGGVFSNAGSVYFATPVGMSALHNQSMGTTYNLPALSSDIYSWIVVPQRLSTAQESRLAQYMQRKAGIAGPDYFEQVDYGPELISNPGGPFTTTTGWTTHNVDITVNAGRLRIAITVQGVYGQARTTISTVVGRTYEYKVSATQGDSIAATAIGITAGGYSIWYENGWDGIRTVYFKATATTTHLYAGPLNNTVGNYVYLNSLSVRELKDGMTGQLLDDNYEPLLMG